MTLTDTQRELLRLLTSASGTLGSREFTYHTEWLGYLPYGQSHWIECGGQDITRAPLDWSLSDLEALEEAGHLRLVHGWQDPADDQHRRMTYELLGL